ncbi:inorganic phosphate transporter [Anoxybacillus sp. KU2-6(11)]|uniref:inorganic phosphate transporter n=1 Tax=Anoxybacillus sp. KU2-6(11) TaxID=1535751 RepID=UPI00050229C3|nr:inorganic phosphate transporter [Anoxybacillus sp. KU2-6(11)]KFZ42591.1 sulfate permease [Anoxybacillus sp. KU2-6(11)]
MVTVAFIIAFFFAMNIGGSGAAATMGAAYGSGTLSDKRIALFICAIAIFLGSLSGGEVVKTIGSGIVPTAILKTDVVVIVLAAATISLFAANVLGIPLSTSEITVGAVVGAGIAYQSLYIGKLLWIVSFWLITPLAAFSFAFFISKWLKGKTVKQNKWVGFLLIIAGFFEAFSAGMNNVANAIGPLVGAGLLSVQHGIIFGGLFVALGALLLGSRVLETNGKKKITTFSQLEGCIISGIGATLVIVSSLFGLPVPLTQITTSAIIGIGTTKSGFSIWQKQIVIQVLKVWIVSPIFALAVSYSLIKLLLHSDVYTAIAIVSVCFATLGTISLKKTITEERRSFHEHGGGI